MNPDRLVYYGRSLGAAVAVELALHRPPDGMVLYSPFTSLADMGAALYAFSPVRLLAGNRLDSLARISRYHGPLLVIHGEADEIIPVEQGRALYEAAPAPSPITRFPGRAIMTVWPMPVRACGPLSSSSCRRCRKRIPRPTLRRGVVTKAGSDFRRSISLAPKRLLPA